MGFKYEVYEWYKRTHTGEDYKYHLEYQGQSLLKAIWIIIKLKRNGSRCIKFEWR